MSNLAPTSTLPGTPAPAPAPAATAPGAGTTDAPGTAPAAGTGDAAPAGTAPASEGLTLEQALAKLEEWKGHSRDWEAKAKANKDAKEKLDKLELDQMSETDRLKKELEDIRTEKAKSDREALLAGIAAAKGVPTILLSGSTKEELEASADALLAFRGQVKPPANDAAASGTHGTPIVPGAQLTREQLKGMSPADIRQAKADGRLNALMGK